MKLPIRQYFRLIAGYLRPLWKRVILLAVFLFGGIALQLWTPQILRTFIDTAQAGGTLETLVRIGLLYLSVTIVLHSSQMGATYATESIKWHATNSLRNDLSDHCMRLDMDFHHKYTPGAMIERIDGDVMELSNFFSQFILRLLGNGVLLLGVLTLLFREHWMIGSSFALFAVLMMYALGKTVSFAVPYWEARRQAMSEMFGLIEEYLGGTEDIRANGAVAYVMRQLRKSIRALYRASRKSFIIGNLTWGSTNIFFAMGRVLSLGLGAWLYSDDLITMGTIFMVYQYGNSLQGPLEQLARQIQDLQSATASIKRIEGLFQERSAITVPDMPERLPSGPLAVSFEDVTFSYTPGTPVLNGIDFRLEEGKVLGLLGRTGSGKSTLTRLLCRLYDPQEGSIRLGNRNLASVSLDEVGTKIGKVTQEVQLFQASLRNNLTFFDPEIPDDRIEEALHILGLGEWYADLPHGLETRLASGGRSLSAGEAQLLAFTRVFLRDPGLVLLDEASSRLDPYTEQLIEGAIDKLLANRTAIIVAHHLTTVHRADDIMILEEGHVVEHGNFSILSENTDTRFHSLLRAGGMVGVLA